MRSPERQPHEIVIEILAMADMGAPKTRISRACNLTTPRLEKYLIKLMEKGIIEKSDFRYFLSQRGEVQYQALLRAKETIDAVVA